MEHNPLKAHFRQPEIYINLPSGGKFWPEGSVRIPVNGELAVYSMTASDEIMMLNPDALMNGESTVKLIQNCIPAIQDAWQTPSTDLESLLIAIRIASNGDFIDIETACPNCQEISPYSLDLKQIVNKFDVDIWSKPLVVSGLSFQFRPLNYYRQNQYDLQLFQFRKKLNHAEKISDASEQKEKINQIVSEFNNIELKYLIEIIQSVQTSSELVTNTEFISEFILNCDKKLYTQIKNHVEKLKIATKCSNIQLVCDDCHHQYQTEVSMDYASFFE